MKGRRPKVAARKRTPSRVRHLGESQVRAARLERGLSQAELAEAAGRQVKTLRVLQAKP